MYTSTTKAITVHVAPMFLEEQSVPDEDRFVWAYHVRIENNGRETVRLMNRYWRITDWRGKIHEVRGEGVIGKQPVLQPGEAYEYTSGTPLDTPSGFMTGSYGMESASGVHFDVRIPAFSLDSPYQAVQIH